MRFVTLCVLVVLGWTVLAADSYELMQLTDIPTAGILQKGQASVYGKVYRENGMLVGANVGLFPRFMFGVSYGAENMVGSEEPEWHEWVEFRAKFRVLDATPDWPALTVGFDSEGHGRWHGDDRRYDIKSRGAYIAASKSYTFLGSLGLHGGVNYSFENEDDDRDVNIFLGLDKSIGPVVTAFAEFDFALNDNTREEDEEEVGAKGDGYLNLGVQFNISDEFRIVVAAYDLLENSPTTIGMDRAIRVQYFMTY